MCLLPPGSFFAMDFFKQGIIEIQEISYADIPIIK